MTGSELDEALAALPVYETTGEWQREKTRRRLRIDRKIQRNQSRARLISNCGGYKPGRGYFSDDSMYGSGSAARGPILHSGVYIRYPGRSKMRNRLINDTNRALRRCREDVPARGNHYRRLIERWWYVDY